MLKIKNLNQYYGSSHTLRDLNLEFKKGECKCVMGRNGVGKSTLCRAIMGLLGVKSGEMNFNGIDILKLPDTKRAMLGIGYVQIGRAHV